METLNIFNSGLVKKAIALLFILLMMGLYSGKTYAADSTLFRIKALQDTVDAGDTIDVDIFIGDSLHLADSLKEFEIELEYDLDICDKTKMDFTLDSSSLSAFFGTAFTNVVSLNTSMGRVDVKVNCDAIGNGTARIGRARFIVQDNVAGKQLLHFDFSKLTAKLRMHSGGTDRPVKFLIDSTWVIKDFRLITSVAKNANEKITVFPNPVSDYLQIQGDNIQKYQLMSVDGRIIKSGNNEMLSQSLMINVSNVNAGEYILMLNIRNEWQNYKLIKK